MAVGPNALSRKTRLFPRRTRSCREWVINRYLAVFGDAMNFAIWHREILRRRLTTRHIIICLDTHRNVYVPGIVEGDSSTGTGIRHGLIEFFRGLPNGLYVNPLAIHNATTIQTIHGRICNATTAILRTEIGIVQIDPTVFLIVGMCCHIQQPA